jgi:hypothetical protein
MNANTTSRVDTIVEMFADNTAGESYADNRLITEETESGNVALVGYGWMKLAEYDETEERVTVFFGHKAIGSKTVSRWLNNVLEQTSERRAVTVSDESVSTSYPTTSCPAARHRSTTIRPIRPSPTIPSSICRDDSAGT